MALVPPVDYIPRKHDLNDACTDSTCTGIRHRVPLAPLLEDAQYLYVPNSLVHEKKTLHSRVTKWYQESGDHKAQFRPDLPDRIQAVHNVVLRAISKHLNRSIGPTQVSITLIDNNTTRIQDKITGKILMGNVALLTEDASFCQASNSRTVHEAMLFLLDQMSPWYLALGPSAGTQSLPLSAAEELPATEELSNAEELSESLSEIDTSASEVESEGDEEESSPPPGATVPRFGKAGDGSDRSKVTGADVTTAAKILQNGVPYDSNIRAFVPPVMKENPPLAWPTDPPPEVEAVEDLEKREPIHFDPDWNEKGFLKLVDDPDCQDTDAIQVRNLLKKWFEQEYRKYLTPIDVSSYNKFISEHGLQSLNEKKKQEIYMKFMSFNEWFPRIYDGVNLKKLANYVFNNYHELIN